MYLETTNTHPPPHSCTQRPAMTRSARQSVDPALTLSDLTSTKQDRPRWTPPPWRLPWTWRGPTITGAPLPLSWLTTRKPVACSGGGAAGGGEEARWRWLGFITGRVTQGVERRRGRGYRKKDLFESRNWTCYFRYETDTKQWKRDVIIVELWTLQIQATI